MNVPAPFAGRLASVLFAASEGLLASVDFGLQLGMTAEMVEHGGLDAAEAEIVRIAFHFRFAETNSFGIAVRGQLIEDGSAGITEGEHAGDFVVGFACGVVTSAADAGVGEFGPACVAIR